MCRRELKSRSYRCQSPLKKRFGVPSALVAERLRLNRYNRGKGRDGYRIRRNARLIAARSNTSAAEVRDRIGSVGRGAKLLVYYRDGRDHRSVCATRRSRF